ncbi:indole-3-acetamide hydrolase [Fusarium heterosporum]|uniref:Indole-3-acetamide hydrolase n=1 Tax=Fusarium heterosporum TaxID=42747 RepID=A0A8H5SVM6_FUSHE|nr:indole-3-acetamide hydrolase [Fusarium heterosporum]
MNSKYPLAMLWPAAITAFIISNSSSSSLLLNNQDQIFSVRDSQYLAVTSDIVSSISYSSDPAQGPMTYISGLLASTNADELEDIIKSSLQKDDVFSEAFLETILVSAGDEKDLDSSVVSYFKNLKANVIYAGEDGPSLCGNSTLTPCPMFGLTDGDSLSISKVFRLYADNYRTFVVGTYEAGDGYRALPYHNSEGGGPSIPVPSRLYSIEDDRPLAGKRIGVKDIYDLEGVQTTAGSLAYASLHQKADTTAPALQRIIDQGGVVVGKQKTAQFASPQSPWDWNDAFYPRNPRGDTFLTCSASSAGSACSIAAYDWLDFAIGTDTGKSIREPAAVAGVFGNRPSQGMIVMDNIVTNAFNADTAGVFARDPVSWVKFAKAWYDSSFHQDVTINGLPALSVTDAQTFPKRLLYPIDHLPMQNPAAEAILQKFLDDVKDAIGVTVDKVNLTQTIEETLDRPLRDMLDDLLVLWTHDLITETAEPLISSYSPGFPAIDEPYRSFFHDAVADDGSYKSAMANRTRDAALWHKQVLFSTNSSCSESILIYDIGTGGLPSFREKDLNDSPGAASPVDPRGPNAVSTVSSYFGDVDITVPIGQVSYLSNVTFQEELMPLTVNMVAKRGCDFVLFNLINELVSKDVLGSVNTGKQLFQE